MRKTSTTQIFKGTLPGLFAVLVLMLSYCSPKTAAKSTPKDRLAYRIDSLMALMTLEEKIGQLTLYTTDWGSTGPTIREGYKNDIRKGACGNLFNSHSTTFVRELQRIAMEETRLKIPLLFGFDVIHGYKTIFPIPLGEAASWDLDAMTLSAHIASKEAAAAGLNWTFAPMVDICRDPRWGRVMEGAGEDPYLGSRIAEARVKGIQSPGIGSPEALLACVKHYAAYGAAIAGRDYNTVDMSERYFREFYLPPYEAAVKAGAATVMTSFNDYDGVPVTGNKYLVTDILRNEWGFRGFVVSDYTGINEMVHHRVVANEKEAGELALSAGVDMDMQGGIYQQYLAQSIKEGKLSMAQIDASVRRILRLKMDLGLFENPYKFCDAKRERETLLSAENRQIARDVSRKSIVLLKNENKALPLSKTGKIALIGPLGDNKSELIGNWNGAGNANDCISLQEALKPYNVSFSRGCDFEDLSKAGFAAAIQTAQNADVVVVAVGEKAQMSGEAASRTNIGLPGVQEELVLELIKTGKPVVVVLMNGRPLAIPRLADKASAILETWWLGTEAGNAIADVLFGDYNPSGKLPISFPRNEGQIPVFYNEKSTGRPYNPDSKWTSRYIDAPNTPLWPFGFGLSYTRFEYGAPVVTPSPGTFFPVQVAISLKNAGDRAGEEVAQLYLRDQFASVTRPVKELKAFQKILLKPGESKTLLFSLDEKAFSFYQKDLRFGPERGVYDIMIGGNSQDLKSVTINY